MEQSAVPASESSKEVVVVVEEEEEPQLATYGKHPPVYPVVSGGKERSGHKHTT